VDAIHSGELAAGEFQNMPVFNLAVPRAVAGVPSEVLMPSETWADAEGYTQTLTHLAELFRNNFKTYADGGGHITAEESAQILKAGPMEA